MTFLSPFGDHFPLNHDYGRKGSQKLGLPLNEALLFSLFLGGVALGSHEGGFSLETVRKRACSDQDKCWER